MRMICPNCEAQYEVDANVIPETGRDVQCSNCGHTWFQRRSELEGGPVPQPAGLLQPEPEPEPAPEPEAEPAPASIPEPEAEPTPEFDVAEFYASVPEPKPEPEITIETPDEPVAPAPDETDETTDETPMSAQDDYSQTQQSDTPHHQPLGEDVVEILREEAERETAERSFGEHDFSVQPSSDLDQAEPNPEPHSQEQTTGLLDQDPEPAPEIAAQPHEAKNKRRNLLPDIEEIKSTLSATKGDDTIDDFASAEQRRSGFRRGVVSAISVFALLALLYMFAGKITAAIPQTETFLSGYVAWIDGLRTTVDRIMLNAVEKLTGLLAQLGSDTST